MATQMLPTRRAALAAVALTIFTALAWRQLHHGMGSAPPPYSDQEITAALSGPSRIDGAAPPDLRLTLTNASGRPLRVLNPECDVIPAGSTRLDITHDGEIVRRSTSGGGGLFLCIPNSPSYPFEAHTTLIPARGQREFSCRLVHGGASRSYAFRWNVGTSHADEGRIQPGRYRLSVHYEVDDAVIAKAFCPGADVTRKYDHIWNGKTDSNTIDLTVH